MTEVLKLLRTIRLDASDTFVFDAPAEPGQWACSGAFRFAGSDSADLTQKQRVALRGGWLGIDDFGWSTLAVVVEATLDERDAAIESLARRLVERAGAPDLETARPAAREEIDFAAALADHPVGTLVAVRRTVEDGSIREQFRTLARRPGGADPLHAGARVFQILESEEEGPDETLDLAALAARENR